MKRSKLTTRKRIGKKSKYVEDDDVDKVNCTASDVITEFIGMKDHVSYSGSSSQDVNDSKSSSILNQFVNKKLYRNQHVPVCAGNSSEKIINQRPCKSIRPIILEEKNIKSKKTVSLGHTDDSLQVAMALSESLRVHEEEKLKHNFSYYHNIGYIPDGVETIKQGAFQSDSCVVIDKKGKRKKNICDIAPGLLTCTLAERQKKVGDRVAAILTEQTKLMKSNCNIFKGHIPTNNLLPHLVKDSPLWSLSKQLVNSSQVYCTKLLERSHDIDRNQDKLQNVFTDTQKIFLNLAESEEEESTIICSGSKKNFCDPIDKMAMAAEDRLLEQAKCPENTGEAKVKTENSVVSSDLPSCHDDVDIFSKMLSTSHFNRMVNHFTNRNDGDLKIQCRDGIVNAHSAILHLHLPWLLQADISVIKWTQFDVNVVNDFLYYIYTGRIRQSTKISSIWAEFKDLIGITNINNADLPNSADESCISDSGHLMTRDICSPDLFEESYSLLPKESEQNNVCDLMDPPCLDSKPNSEAAIVNEARGNSTRCSSCCFDHGVLHTEQETDPRDKVCQYISPDNERRQSSAGLDLSVISISGESDDEDRIELLNSAGQGTDPRDEVCKHTSPDKKRQHSASELDLSVITLSGMSGIDDEDASQPINSADMTVISFSPSKSKPISTQSLSDIWEHYPGDNCLPPNDIPEVNSSQCSLPKNQIHSMVTEFDLSVIKVPTDSRTKNDKKSLGLNNHSEASGSPHKPTEVNSDLSDLWDNFPRDDHFPYDYAQDIQVSKSTECNLSIITLCEDAGVGDKEMTLPWSDSLNATALVQQCSTPKSTTRKDKSFLITDKVTPKPDYQKMMTPEVKNELKKYGLRRLSRKKAVTMLNFIYDQLHPYEDTNTQENDAEPQLTQSSDMSDSLDVLEESLILSQLSEPEQGFASSVKELIKNDPIMFSKILMYQPINFENLTESLKASGIKHKQNDLVEFLDQEVVTSNVYMA